MVMKAHTVTLAVLLFAVLLFAAVNWSLFSQSSTINFLFYRIDAPLGIIMLGIVGVMSVLYTLFIGKAEVASLMQERRQNRALEEARAIAAETEQSRIAALEASLTGRLEGVSGEISTLRDMFESLSGKFEHLEATTANLVRRFDEEGVFIVRGDEDSKERRSGETDN